ncbi:MAG: hypothetical protein ACLUKN_10870 [Bacilli bacterium]
MTEPYLYNNKVLMVEYSAPIMQDSRFVGQVAFDRDLTNFQISSLISSPAARLIYFFKLSGKDNRLHKNQNLRTLSIYDLYTDDSGAFVMSFAGRKRRLVRDDSVSTDVSKFGSAYRDILSAAFETAKN